MDWNDVLQTIIQAIIPVVLSLITYGSYLLKKKIDELLDTEQKKNVAKMVVQYIEQTMKDATNDEKKRNAVYKASAWLSEKGIDVSTTELELLIESSVNAVKNGVQKAENNQSTDENKSDEIKTLQG